mmetsp:Transcript_15138/g.34893  ORF Transcript_15138/g.34893 Transcript_15138/m.34893 type:complete len:297 (-) Transcript_15138:123-1013(-)
MQGRERLRRRNRCSRGQWHVLQVLGVRTIQQGGGAIPLSDPQNLEGGCGPRRSHRNGDQVALWRPDALRPAGRDPPPVDHKENLLEGRCRGIAVVHFRKHQRQPAEGKEDRNLGRERLQGIPREPRPGPPRGGRPGSGVRVPVAALWGGVQGHARRLHRPGRGPAGRLHRQDQEQPGGPPDPHECLESVRPRRNGPAAVPPLVPVLRRHPIQRGQLPHVPAVGRHGTGGSLQHCQLRPVDAPRGARDGPQAGRTGPHAGRRPRVSEPHRTAAGAARADPSTIPEAVHRRPRPDKNH